MNTRALTDGEPPAAEHPVAADHGEAADHAADDAATAASADRGGATGTITHTRVSPPTPAAWTALDQRSEAIKAERIAAASAQARDPELAALLAVYWRYVPADEMVDRSPEDLLTATRSHRELAGQRVPGQLNLRVTTPRPKQSGWCGGHSVIEIVTDDMPFLVDSVTAELAKHDIGIHLIVHPQLVVGREVLGALNEVRCGIEPESEAAADELVVPAGEEDGGVARRGDLAPLVDAREVEVDGGAVAVGQVLAGDRAPQPLRVADVVEQAELAVELPQPGVVAHPVGAQVDQPRLPHAAVVERGRVARPLGELGVPVHPLHHVGDVERRRGGRSAGCAGGSGRRQAQRLHAVEAHAHADVPADHVGDGERALHHRADRVALVDVLPPAGLGAARRLATRTAASISAISSSV